MIEATFKWAFRCNERRTVRQRIAHVLRELATRIDNRVSLAIDIETHPPISSREKAECILAGLETIKWSAQETARSAAEELILDHVMKAKHDANH